MGDLAFHLWSRRPVGVLPCGVALRGFGSLKYCFFRVDGDGASRCRGGAALALRTRCAVLGEVGATGTVGAAPDVDDVTGRAANGVGFQVDVEVVFAEAVPASSSRRDFGFHVETRLFQIVEGVGPREALSPITIGLS